MFQIPSFYEMDMDLAAAVEIMRRHGDGSCLEGMKAMNRRWDHYVASDDQDDDEFFSNWIYEVNAYNVVYQGMSELFAPKEVA